MLPEPEEQGLVLLGGMPRGFLEEGIGGWAFRDQSAEFRQAYATDALLAERRMKALMYNMQGSGPRNRGSKKDRVLDDAVGAARSACRMLRSLDLMLQEERCQLWVLRETKAS